MTSKALAYNRNPDAEIRKPLSPTVNPKTLKSEEDRGEKTSVAKKDRGENFEVHFAFASPLMYPALSIGGELEGNRAFT